MGWAIHNLAGSIAGTQQAARVAKRQLDRKVPASAKRARDEFDQSADASEVEHAEPVRSLKDNTQEEAHEDRQEHGAQERLATDAYDVTVVYGPANGKRPARRPASPGMDLEG